MSRHNVNLWVKALVRVCRFVQLSDIHFGQERDGAPLHNDVRKMLLKDAAELAERHGAANLIIVVGDTAFSGKETEYRETGEWLDALAAAVRCGVTDVRVVPGNHDCDRTQIPDWVLDTIHRTIRAATPKSAHSHLRGISKGPKEANPLLPKIKAYRKFALGYDSDFDSMGCPTWTKDFELAAGVVLRLVGMNSVQVSDAETERPI